MHFSDCQHRTGQSINEPKKKCRPFGQTLYYVATLSCLVEYIPPVNLGEPLGGTQGYVVEG
jgi:hypothetical protein